MDVEERDHDVLPALGRKAHESSVLIAKRELGRGEPVRRDPLEPGAGPLAEGEP